MELSRSGGWLCCLTPRGKLRPWALGALFSYSVGLPSPSNKEPPYFFPITHMSILDPLQPQNSLPPLKVSPKLEVSVLHPALSSVAQSCQVAAQGGEGHSLKGELCVTKPEISPSGIPDPLVLWPIACSPGPLIPIPWGQHSGTAEQKLQCF